MIKQILSYILPINTGEPIAIPKSGDIYYAAYLNGDPSGFTIFLIGDPKEETRLFRWALVETGYALADDEEYHCMIALRGGAAVVHLVTKK